MNKLKTKVSFSNLTRGALLCLLTATANAQEVSPECRGVAAGVVAAMKSSGEITDANAAQAAVIAARRACSAARETEFGGVPATGATTAQASKQSDENEDDTSVWDFLTGDRKTKDGHDRLRRLKTQ